MGHAGLDVLSNVLTMERQEISPESNVECELCDKTQVWTVVAGAFPEGASCSCSYIEINFVRLFSFGCLGVCPCGVCSRGSPPRSLLCSARLLLVCSFGLVWFHIHPCPHWFPELSRLTPRTTEPEESQHGHVPAGCWCKGVCPWLWTPPQ